MTAGSDSPSEFQPYIDPSTGQAVPGYVVDPTSGEAIPRPDSTDATPTSEHSAADGAFGFQEAPVPEKYNTEYIVAKMRQGQRFNKTLILGILIAAVLGMITWAAL